MTVKEQERKALAQIREIVEALGPDSYVGTALDGCFEIAEQNIENDWACSMKHRVESAEAQVTALRAEIASLYGACTTCRNNTGRVEEKCEGCISLKPLHKNWERR